MNDINITISNEVKAVSNLEIGVTITQVAPDKNLGTEEARKNVNKAIQQLPTAIYNVHAFGFGVTNNVVNENGVYNWSELDRRITWLTNQGVEQIMLTFWSAPDHMRIKSSDPTYKIVDPNKLTDFADLVYETLIRYKNHRITHIQIWNELKGYGFYHADWDIVAYTNLYNAVYNRIRFDFPNIKIGGPYLILDRYHIASDKNTLNTWYNAVNGVNGLSVDLAITHGLAELALKYYLQDTKIFYDIALELKAQFPALEYWSSENYIISDLTKYTQFPIHFQACWSACLLYYELLAGVNVSLAWGLQGDAALPYDGIQRSWCYDTRSSFKAGETTPIYDIYRIFNYCFSPGTEIVESASTDPMVLVLASKDFVLVINTHDTQKNIFVEGKLRTLEGYQFGMYIRS